MLQFLSSLYPLKELSFKLLTFKVTALIALAAAPRVQTFVYMNRDILISLLLKTSKVGHVYTLKFEHFRDERLWAMHTILHYIKLHKVVEA